MESFCLAMKLWLLLQPVDGNGREAEEEENDVSFFLLFSSLEFSNWRAVGTGSASERQSADEYRDDAGSTDRINFFLVTFGGTTFRLVASNNFRESTDFARQTRFALTQFRSVISCLLFYLCIVRKCSFVCTGILRNDAPISHRRSQSARNRSPYVATDQGSSDSQIRPEHNVCFFVMSQLEKQNLNPSIRSKIDKRLPREDQYNHFPPRFLLLQRVF
jgi:hypothetical protein